MPRRRTGGRRKNRGGKVEGSGVDAAEAKHLEAEKVLAATVAKPAAESISPAPSSVSIISVGSGDSPAADSRSVEVGSSSASGVGAPMATSSGVLQLKDIKVSDLNAACRARLDQAKKLCENRKAMIAMQLRAHEGSRAVTTLLTGLEVFFEEVQSFYVTPFISEDQWKKEAQELHLRELAKIERVMEKAHIPHKSRAAYRARTIMELENGRDKLISQYDRMLRRYKAVFSRMETLADKLKAFLTENLQVKPDFEVLFRLIETAIGEFVNVLPRMRTFVRSARLQDASNALQAKVFELNDFFQSHYDAALAAERLTPASLSDLNKAGGVLVSRAFLQCMRDRSIQSAYILVYTMAFIRLSLDTGVQTNRDFVLRNISLLVDANASGLTTGDLANEGFRFFLRQALVQSHSGEDQSSMLPYFNILLLDVMLASPNCDPFAAIQQYFNAADSRVSISAADSELRQLEILLGMMRMLLAVSPQPQEVQFLTVVFSSLDAVDRLNKMVKAPSVSWLMDATANKRRVEVAVTQFERIADDELWAIAQRDGSERPPEHARADLEKMAKESLVQNANCESYWACFEVDRLVNLAESELKLMSPAAQAQVVGNRSFLIKAVVVAVHKMYEAGQIPTRSKVVTRFARNVFHGNPEAVTLGLPWLLAGNTYREGASALEAFSGELDAAYREEQAVLAAAKAAERAARQARLEALLAEADEADDSSDSEGEPSPAVAIAASRDEGLREATVLESLFDFGSRASRALPTETAESMRERLCAPSSLRGDSLADQLYWQVMLGEKDLLLSESDLSLDYFCEDLLSDASFFLTRFACVTGGALSRNPVALMGHMDRAEACLKALVDKIASTGHARYIGRAHNLMASFYDRCEDLSWIKLKSDPWNKWAWYTHAIEQSDHHLACENAIGVTAEGGNLTAATMYAHRLQARAESAIRVVDRKVRERERLLRAGMLRARPGSVPGTSVRSQDTKAGLYFRSRLLAVSERAKRLKEDLPRGRVCAGGGGFSVPFCHAGASVLSGDPSAGASPM